MTRYVVVTGTTTGIGKTIATAALAARWDTGSTVVVKPVQTGADGSEPSDAQTVAELTGVTTMTLVSLPEPLAPATAARRSGLDLPTVRELAAQIRDIDAELVLVEGAGGLLVQMDLAGGTIADLALELDADVVVVTGLELGTLNHTALTLEALEHRGCRVLGLVIGSVPHELGLAERCNIEDLGALGAPVIGSIQHGASELTAHVD